MGAVFGIFAGFTYWFGKMSGYLYNKWLAAAHFWFFFIGVNMVFFPQHMLGLNGMPRRIPDYQAEFELWNKISSIGAIVTLIGVVFFLLWLAEAFWKKRPAADKLKESVFQSHHKFSNKELFHFERYSVDDPAPLDKVLEQEHPFFHRISDHHL